ncbi:MAG TPA: HD domain-containing phosphohydrolase [Vicinamibacteria bacterium]|nr:HD domain-containing phosphohydrolase [Vicinamibacteria bacterium]
MAQISFAPVPARTPPQAQWSCHQVLVVDDDKAFAQSICDAILDRDIEAIAVTDPREAIELARQTPFAAAVVDLIMPGMDGLELARELRRGNPATEVVMLTGHADMSSAIEGIRNELFDYLQKDSLQTIRLRRAVRAAIARSELQAENRRLVTGLQETTARLRILSDVSARLASQHHLDELIGELLEATREIVGSEKVRLLLMESNDLGDMTIRAAYGDGEVSLGGPFGPGDGIATQVAQTGASVRFGAAQDHPNYSPRCDDMGASLPGFLCVPIQRPNLVGALVVAGRRKAFTDEELSLVVSLARQGAIAIENATIHESYKNFFTHASDMLVWLLDAQDPHYDGHSRAVAALTDMVTRRLGLPDHERRTLHYAALLHDVGKLRLSPGLLGADRALSAEEMAQVRQHPALGVEILRPISVWGPLAPIIHTHHERWDGQGYPRGLKQGEIPLGGRIVAVAEAFEAMRRRWPNGRPLSVDEALAEIEACAGTQFDPSVARVFIEEYRANRDSLPPRA